MDELSDKVDEPKNESKKDYTARAFGVFAASSIGIYLTTNFFYFISKGTDMIESITQPNLTDVLISFGIGALIANTYYALHKSTNESKSNIIRYTGDSVLVDIMEGKSKLPELEQKKILLTAFYKTIPGNWQITDTNLEMVIIYEGWGKKPVKSMVKSYAPCILYNLRGMGRLKDYREPYFG